MEKLQPDYKRIYSDIIAEKYPDKEEKCKHILVKKTLSYLDVIKLNTLIFGLKNKERENKNQKHRSYDISTIMEILDYQRKNRLNNSQLATHFKLSRNSVAKWKKLFNRIKISKDTTTGNNF